MEYVHNGVLVTLQHDEMWSTDATMGFTRCGVFGAVDHGTGECVGSRSFGLEWSPSFIGAPEGKGIAERFM